MAAVRYNLGPLKTPTAKTYLLVNPDGPGAEGDALAEGLDPPGRHPVTAQANVLAVDAVEAQRGQVVGSTAGAGGAGRWG